MKMEDAAGFPSRNRLRRQYGDYNSYASSTFSSGGYETLEYPIQEAPIYGYGYAKLKCKFVTKQNQNLDRFADCIATTSNSFAGCCALSNYKIDYSALTMSYKCPVGSKGPPGPTG